MKALNITIIFLLGMLFGIVLAGTLLSPEFHKIDCNDGISVQEENGVKKKTYIPALDTCKEKK